jgi:uncharacterized membrane protein (UPF0127 family)
VTVRDANGRPVADRAVFAARFGQRLLGRMGSPELQPGEGLLLRPCSSVHTCFCHGAMDLVFLDRDDRVLAVAPAVRPWRFRGVRGAEAVLELAPGAAAGLRAGERLSFEEGAGGPPR